MSLRLKISNLTTGDIHKVIQPFAEYITFEDDNLHTSDAPNLGLTVQEYLSPAFKDLQYGPEINTPFTSEIRLYNHPNGSKVIRQGDGCFNHTGSRVNKILS
jgi:hypothetical protein